MSIKINTEKIIINGKKYRRILLPLCGALSDEEVPEEYLNSSFPAFIWNKTNLNFKERIVLLLYCNNYEELLSLRIYPENEFQQIISYIRKAGCNLRKINQKLKLEQWKGKEEFVI